MRTLDGFHVEVEGAGFWVWADGGIAGVGEGAGLAVAKAGDVMFVAAEILLFWGSVGRWWLAGFGRSDGVERGRGDILEFEGAELLVYHLPDYFV